MSWATVCILLERLGLPVLKTTGSPRRLLFILYNNTLLLAGVFYWNVLGYLCLNVLATVLKTTVAQDVYLITLYKKALLLALFLIQP